VIFAEDVHVHFRTRFLRRKVRALNGLTLEVRDGDFFALVGQNGAGKSTAMYCFLGLLRPTSGKVEIMGQVPELGCGLYKNIAYLPEWPHYHLYLTVDEATRYYSSLSGKCVSDKAINESLERLGLAQFKSHPLAKCSKGMKQKVGIAQCLIHEPKVLFLDEPTRGLDPLIVREFRETLREIHQRGATIVMNSHVLSEIEMLASRVPDPAGNGYAPGRGSYRCHHLQRRPLLPIRPVDESRHSIWELEFCASDDRESSRARDIAPDTARAESRDPP